MAPLKLYTTDPAWLVLAAREIGQHELAGLGADNPRILEYGTAVDLHVTHDEIAWCSNFVNWCMREAGYARTRSALAVSWLKYGMPIDSTQERGAIVVIRRKDAAPDPNTGTQTGNHVGFLLSASPTHVTILGGNQSDSVCVKTFSRGPQGAYDVRSARWPRACDKIVGVPAQAA